MRNNAIPTVCFVAVLCAMILCLLAPAAPVERGAQTDDFVRFKVSAPEMTEEEYAAYYASNNIMPMMADGSDEYNKNNDDIIKNLNDMYPEYVWADAPSQWRCLSDTYGSNPQNTAERIDQYIIDAKADLEITDLAGCGAIAMMSQMNYLAEGMGYSALNSYSNDNQTNAMLNINRYFRAKDILEFTPSTSWGDAGTSIMPSSFLIGANRFLEKYGLEDKIDVYGDLVSRAENLSQKIATVKEAIDRGICVIWWTGAEFGNFKTHYMNIFGYQIWRGIDSSGNIKEHVFFETNMNWGNPATVYVNSDAMQPPTMGFIFFQAAKPQLWVQPSKLGIQLAYNAEEMTKNNLQMNANALDMPMTVRYLRTAFVNHYDSTNTVVDARYLSLSSRKQGAGVAYIEFGFPTAVSELHFDVSWWKSADKINSAFGDAELQYKDATGNWITAIDFLISSNEPSIVLTAPSKYKITFGENVSVFRFYTAYNNPTNTGNSGRFILHDMNVFF